MKDRGPGSHPSGMAGVRGGLSLCLAVSQIVTGVVFSQEAGIFQMSPPERAAYLARINAESERSWHGMVESLRVELPRFLPPPSSDPARPGNTFQKEGSSNWYDSAGNLYTRSAWGTWNNYDEAKSNPFPDLPDPLKTPYGREINDGQTWWREQRPWLAGEFEREIYGREPGSAPSVHWEVTRTQDTAIGRIPATTKWIVGHVDTSAYPAIKVDIHFSVTVPAHASFPVPVIMEFGFVFPPGFRFPGSQGPEEPGWQEQVLGRGWGYAVYIPTSVQADNAAGLTGGIIGLVNRGQPRRPGDWGALRAWAWGASRVLDFFETDASIDSKRVGIEGVSRYGKAVLVTMAFDERFAIALVGSSGKGGAALFRRDYGESMGNLCSSGEFHWFAGAMLRYVLNPGDLSVDSHELISLCAPRPVFISCGSPAVEGRWVDDTGQFMAERAAGPVYALLGKKGLEAEQMPPIGVGLFGGELAFRQHGDGHTVGPNWPHFLEFAQRFFEAAPASRTR